MRSARSRLLPLLALLPLVWSCASYYRRTIEFQSGFARGDYAAALEALDRGRGARRERDRLLYLLQRGETLHLLGRYEESNEELERAYRWLEDTRRDYAVAAAGLLTNPTIVPYRGEDFEVVQLHYYKALNFMLLGRYEEALVECRRLDLRVRRLEDARGRGIGRARYSTDAFALNLMGMLFEASGELNDAFVSYRNAYEAYRDVYDGNFGLPPPLQLKRDLLRTARANGFTEELRYYERELGMEASGLAEDGQGGGTVVVLWNDGLAPVKEQWSIDFAVVRNRDGSVLFVNADLGLAFPFGRRADGGEGSLPEDLRLVRVAFPRYRARGPAWSDAEAAAGGRTARLEPAQDLGAIAVASLEDRLLRELSVALLRLAVKQAAESALRRRSQGLGVLLSIVNAATETADTRGWQTLPAVISYARLAVPAGASELALTLSSHDGAVRQVRLPVEVGPGETRFVVYTSPEVTR